MFHEFVDLIRMCYELSHCIVGFLLLIYYISAESQEKKRQKEKKRRSYNYDYRYCPYC